MVADKLYCYLRNTKWSKDDLFFTSLGDKVTDAEPWLFDSKYYRYKLSHCVNETLLCTNEMLNW